MKVKFGTWSFNRRVDLKDHVKLLEHEQCDIVALQGVRPKALDALMKSGLYDASWPIRGSDSLDPHGCVLLYTARFRMLRPVAINVGEFTGRAATAELAYPGGELVAASFHVPNGSKYGRRKLEFIRAVTSWLQNRPDRTLVGIDANAPKSDHPDHEHNEWWWPDDAEPGLLGHDPAHRLRDALREYYKTHPSELEELTGVRPYGPLAASYVEHGIEEAHRRYDFILATPDCLKEIANVRYIPYRDANGDGEPDLQPMQDHAFVVAELEVG